MPKFLVTKGQDAWIIHEAVVEAGSIAEANEVADRRDFDAWVKSDEVRAFDHEEIFPEETEAVEDDFTVVPPRPAIHLSGQEIATVLAGLRLLQHMDGTLGVPAMIANIRTDGDTVEALDAERIDALCERINQ